MGDFVTAKRPLPSPKVDAFPPQGQAGELDASDINDIWGALDDVRTGIGFPNRTVVTDSDYAVTPTDFLISFNQITAQRTVTLPSASAGLRQIIIKDESGSASEAIPISVLAQPGEKVDGTTSPSSLVVIIRSFGSAALYSNGVEWRTLYSDKAYIVGTGAVPRSLDSMILQTVGIDVRSYGAKGDGLTDDTPAIQAAINFCATSGARLYLPSTGFGKSYKFTRLFFYYDAVLNPGYPQGDNGRTFTVVGDGPADDFLSGTLSQHNRTTLVSTDTTGPALNFNGGAGYVTRQAVISDIAVVASNSTCVISLVAVNTHTILRHLTIEQDGTGGGIDWTDIWVSAGLEDVIIQNGAASITAGSVGLRMRNSTLDGGGVSVRRVTVQQRFGGTGGFDIGMQFGAQVGENSFIKNIDAITCDLCISQSHNKGIVLGKGVKGATFTSAHTEFNNTLGIQITNTARGVALIGCFFYNRTATQADLVIDGDATSNSQHAINIQGCSFEGVFNYGIDFVNAAFTSGTIIGNWFSRFGAGTGTGIRTRSNSTPWAVYHNAFSGMAASFDDTTVIAMLDNLGGAFSVRGLLNTAGGLSPGTPAGAFQGGVLYQGSGVPSNANGNNGDYYFRTDTPAVPSQCVYVKSAGAWIGESFGGGTPVALTGQVANLAATNIFAAAPAGTYRVSATARTTTSGTGTTATLNIIWTDEGGVKTLVVGTWALNSVTITGQVQVSVVVQAAAASNIQVSITAGTYGTSAYALSAIAERLN